MQIRPVILAGGFGRRLYPYSTEELPKQFITTSGNESLFIKTFQRTEAFLPPLVLANNTNKYLLKYQLAAAKLTASHIIFEEVSINNAVSIAVSCFMARENELILMLPSDHVINDTLSFISDVNAAMKLAEDGRIVSFGIKPDAPNINYGYLLNNRLVEKPDCKKAAELISLGAMWNSGIYLFSPKTMLKELAKYCPELYSIVENLALCGGMKCQFEDHLISAASIKSLKAESIDYAVMRHSDNLISVPASFDWMDVGCKQRFESLFDCTKLAKKQFTYRPWGRYKRLVQGSFFQTKVLEILPHHKISLQKHALRGECWKIISGEAEVFLDNNAHLVEAGDKIFIPENCLHSIENLRGTPLKLVEIQLCLDCREDDIIRVNKPLEYGT
jgi:mannose-1-phosphate guanylyltransferase